MYIAHYTTIETAFGHIIPTQKMRFSALSSTNDPYEVRYDWHLGHFVFGTSQEDVSAQFRYNDKIRKKIRDKVRIGCFSYGNSLINCGNNTMLWTYYASGKAGIDTGCALIFSEADLIKKINECKSARMLWNGKIEYISRKQLIRNSVTRSGISVVESFSKKINWWKQEREYRIIIETKSKNSGYFEVDISSCIVGVVLNGMALNKVRSDYQKATSEMYGTKIKFIRRFYNTSKHKYQLYA